jgi:hypothetical protein
MKILIAIFVVFVINSILELILIKKKKNGKIKNKGE